MRRPYVLDDYRRTVDWIRARLPHATIGSDIIVGFPASPRVNSRRSAEYLESSPLTMLHVFPYSDRPGTKATQMAGKVAGLIVTRPWPGRPRNRSDVDDAVQTFPDWQRAAGPHDRGRQFGRDRQRIEVTAAETAREK